MALLASHALAEEFSIIPFPFVGADREEIEAEFAMLLQSGVKPRELTDMLLYAIEMLLNANKKEKDQRKIDKRTSELSDLLGRLLVFEEMFLRNTKR
jgi:hypothetical protein